MTKPIDPAMVDRMVALRFPLIAMPHVISAFTPLQEPGTRYLLASDGLYVEIRRAWLYARFRVAATRTPYGPVSEQLISRYRPNRSELDRFTEQAKAAGKVETAAWIVWNETTGATRYLPLKEKMANCVRIDVERPLLGKGEHLVLDLHSHHVMSSDFSGTDDRDDLESREVKFAAVIGRINQQPPQWSFRLCVEGHAFSGEAPGPAFQYGDLP